MVLLCDWGVIELFTDATIWTAVSLDAAIAESTRSVQVEGTSPETD